MITKTHKSLVLLAGMMLTGQATALERSVKYPAIYPFVPMTTDEIYKDVSTVTENPEFEKNFFTIIRKGLSKAKTKQKPWTSTYWPMSKGMIADPYEKSTLSYYVDVGWIDWESNYDSFKKRLRKKLANVDSMSQESLNKLAPSEKYDVLLGDRTFDLTNRVWQYTHTWGSQKENGFVSRLFLAHDDALSRAEYYVDVLKWWSTYDDAFKYSWELRDTLSAKNALALVKMGKYDNVKDAYSEALEMAKEQEGEFVLAKKNSRLAGWEGICNGWSTAAGNVPRPRKPVSFKMDNGKNLKFYPEDIKGLVSMFWVNSLVQNNYVKDLNEPDSGKFFGGTVSAGKRCNIKARKDIWGRKYDNKPDPFNGDHSARCSGVHPAKWHLGIVDIIGRQGRSFIVERKVGPAVDNHPMYKYKMEYFNPYNGREYDNEDKLDKNIERISDEDQFKQFRHKDAVYVVGVETKMTYMNYVKPRRQSSDSEENDETDDKKMWYDLELDEDYNIVGGQWRAIKVGQDPNDNRSASSKSRLNHNQPDFFWNVTKDWNDTSKSDLFKEEKIPEKWRDETRLPPKSWKDYAVGNKEKGIDGSHAFMYSERWDWGNGRTCDVVNKKTGKITQFPCNMEINKPQPLLNVINKLVKLSK